MNNICIEDPLRLREGSRFERRLINATNSPHDFVANIERIFSVASYNVLSQHLLDRHPEHYAGCNEDCLGWSFRSGRIIEEILHFMPDIICLQEVHHSQYRHFFMKKLNSFGYFGKYKKRPEYDNEDGCATFFKMDKFWLDEDKPLVYDSYDDECDGKYNIAMVLVLTHKASQRNVCVANTHLLFNPKRGDIKLTQLSILLAEVEALRHKYSAPSHIRKATNNHTPYVRASRHRQASLKQQNDPHPCGVLLCGDFNLVPFSPLHSFLSHGDMDASKLMCSQLSGNLSPGYPSAFRPLISTRFLPSQINSNCQFIPQLIQKQLSNSEQKHQNHPQQMNISNNFNNFINNFGNESNNDTNNIHQVPANSTQCQHNSNQKQQILRNIANNNTSCNNFTNNNFTNNNNYTNTSINPQLLTHRLNLASAYPHLVQIHMHNSHFTDMQVTQSHLGEPCKTVDYIFYGVDEKRTSNKNGVYESEVKKDGPLKLLNYLQLPVVSSDLQPIPNHFNGSDHLLILAHFLLN